MPTEATTADCLPLVVIGAGPAGLMAAGTAAALGRPVWLVEQMQSPGKKLRLTGLGRCNCANSAPLMEFLTHCYPDRRWLSRLFHQFFTPQTLAFLHHIGVETCEEVQGRIFPRSGSAQAVTDALLQWCRRCGVRLLTGHRVVAVECAAGQIRHIAVRRSIDQQTIHMPVRAVIVATGGCSYPQTGSSGDGYDLARNGGHTIIEPVPALVALHCDDEDLQACAGVTLGAARVDLFSSGKKAASREGELLFTHTGLSGPAALSISREINCLRRQGIACDLSIDLTPSMTEKQLDHSLVSELNANGNKQIAGMLKQFIPLRLAQALCARCHIAAEQKCNQISATQRRQIGGMLKHFPVAVLRTGTFSEAMVTAGGVSVREVDPATCRSRLVSNLYIAGEVLDCDADTGGYNLQIAFSSGYCAGKAAGAG